MKKFNDIFSRRQDNERSTYQEVKPKRVFFNQSYFNCQLVYQPHKLSLIKVQANIAVGPDAGTPLLTHCRWFIKTNNRFKQIPDLKSTCYQPCIDDVGSQQGFQIEPSIEGKSYSGATITKQTMPIELGPAIESSFTEIKNKLYHFNEFQQFNLKIEKIKNEVGLSFPIEGKATIKRRNENEEIFVIHLEGGSFDRTYFITKEYPQVQFIRNSFNTTLLKCIKDEEIRVTFETTADRDIFGLLVRTLSATSIDIALQVVNDEGETVLKEEEQQQTNTTLAQNEGEKVEDMGKINEEIIQLRKDKKEIIQKYNFEKQTRIKLEGLIDNYNRDKAELQSLKRQLSRLKEQNEQYCSDNRFYINELTIIKKQLKEVTKEKEDLAKDLEEIQQQKKIFLSTKLNEKKEIISPEKLRSLEDKLEVEKAIKEEAIQKSQWLKEREEKLENELKVAKNKIDSLVKEQIKKQKVEQKEPQVKVESNTEELKEKEAIIENLRFKMGNLENLLKYKMSEPGGENLTFQKIISNLTETVTEKEEELRQLRKVNKELLSLLKNKG